MKNEHKKVILPYLIILQLQHCFMTATTFYFPEYSDEIALVAWLYSSFDHDFGLQYKHFDLHVEVKLLFQYLKMCKVNQA